jgi:hypothetical protein
MTETEAENRLVGINFRVHYKDLIITETYQNSTKQSEQLTQIYNNYRDSALLSCVRLNYVHLTSETMPPLLMLLTKNTSIEKLVLVNYSNLDADQSSDNFNAFVLNVSYIEHIKSIHLIRCDHRSPGKWEQTLNALTRLKSGGELVFDHDLVVPAYYASFLSSALESDLCSVSKLKISGYRNFPCTITALSKNTSLTHLDLSGTDVLHTQLFVLAKALRVNSVLWSVQLRVNSRDSDDGILSIIESIRVTSPLLELIIINNSANVALPLIDLLSENPALTKVSFAYHSMTPEFVAALEHAIEKNTHLRILDLNSFPSTPTLVTRHTLDRVSRALHYHNATLIELFIQRTTHKSFFPLDDTIERNIHNTRMKARTLVQCIHDKRQRTT